MRAFFLVALVFTLIYMIVAGVFTGAASTYRTLSYMDSYTSSYGDSGYSDYYSSGYDDAEENATRTGGLLSAVFLLIFDVVFLLGLIKIKTKTMKVISIIGLSLTTIMMAWAVMVIGSPGSLSFDEVGPAFICYGVVLLAFNIIGVIHAFKTKT